MNGTSNDAPRDCRAPGASGGSSSNAPRDYRALELVVALAVMLRGTTEPPEPVVVLADALRDYKAPRASGGSRRRPGELQSPRSHRWISQKRFGEL